MTHTGDGARCRKITLADYGGHGFLLYDLSRVLEGRIAEMFMLQKFAMQSRYRIAPAGGSSVRVFVSR